MAGRIVLMKVACMNSCMTVGLGKVKVGLVIKDMKILLEFKLMFPFRVRRGAEGLLLLLLFVWFVGFVGFGFGLIKPQTEGSPEQV